MIAGKHKALKFMRRELGALPETSWIQQFPVPLVEALLRRPAMVARWIIQEEPEWLTRKNIKITVTGPEVSADGGAWWGLLGPLVGKPPDWAVVEILMEHGVEIQRTLPIPKQFERICTISRVTTEAFVEPETFRGDLLVLGGLQHVYMDFLFHGKNSRGKNGASEFLGRGGIVVGEADRKLDAYINSAYAQAKGLSSEVQEDMYPESSASLDDKLCRAVVTVRAGGGSPVDTKNLLGAVDAIKEATDDIFGERDIGANANDDLLQWGVEGVLKSSLDVNDTYLTLPAGYVVRRSTGNLYHKQADLAVGDALRIAIDVKSLATFEIDQTSWIERAGFASQVWSGLLGPYVNNTLGGALRKKGFDPVDNKMSLEDFALATGLPVERAQLLDKALHGGDPYSPNRAERELFDLLERGDVGSVMQKVRVSPALAIAMDESRRPLILVIGLMGQVEAMDHLAELGADINAVDGGGRPVLVELAATAETGVMAKAIQLGADINCWDYLGWTALLVALKSGRWATVELLLSNGANPLISGPAGQNALDFVEGKGGMIGPSFESIESVLGFDMRKALKQNGFVLDASEIPDHIKSKVRESAQDHL